MQSVKIGILGLGTVGSGTVSVLKRNSKEISRRAGRGIEILRAADKNLDSPKTCDLNGIDLTDDAFSVVNDPEIQIIVELIGGTGIARDLVMQAIENGKHVVTANKALIAMHGNELFAKAQEKGVTIAFEAAVAGGIPIIKAIREGLAANRIEWLAGIINGTGNFILTEMRDKGRNFADVLAEAQALGYAEADPTFDVEGIDAAHKLTIMASIAFDIVRALTTDPENRVPHLAFQPDSLKDTPILPMSEVITSYYLRINTEDKPGVLADITRIFSEQDINIEAILQKQPEEEEGTVPIIMLTQPVVEKNMDEAIAQIEALDTVKHAIMRIRMESLG